ncbi:proteophosphoglycan PPG1 [Besnoitia besnoiti]|uniref:Proteophosphoglycan PPG1 n=1 Tax=Besnoitia besnoiti TaxID=94643 RepID=A0A2A9ME21_BESBE|nr:proteophosphoglycan PPG1 [Besnoitia besnoiti]PFH35444.1 proteophosphoglycan PPG1 [Besnoitia besnoiti]
MSGLPHPRTASASAPSSSRVCASSKSASRAASSCPASGSKAPSARVRRPPSTPSSPEGEPRTRSVPTREAADGSQALLPVGRGENAAPRAAAVDTSGKSDRLGSQPREVPLRPSPAPSAVLAASPASSVAASPFGVPSTPPSPSADLASHTAPSPLRISLGRFRSHSETRDATAATAGGRQPAAGVFGAFSASLRGASSPAPRTCFSAQAAAEPAASAPVSFSCPAREPSSARSLAVSPRRASRGGGPSPPLPAPAGVSAGSRLLPPKQRPEAGAQGKMDKARGPSPPETGFLSPASSEQPQAEAPAESRDDAKTESRSRAIERIAEDLLACTFRFASPAFEGWQPGANPRPPASQEVACEARPSSSWLCQLAASSRSLSSAGEGACSFAPPSSPALAARLDAQEPAAERGICPSPSSSSSPVPASPAALDSGLLAAAPAQLAQERRRPSQSGGERRKGGGEFPVDAEAAEREEAAAARNQTRREFESCLSAASAMEPVAETAGAGRLGLLAEVSGDENRAGFASEAESALRPALCAAEPEGPVAAKVAALQGAVDAERLARVVATQDCQILSLRELVIEKDGEVESLQAALRLAAQENAQLQAQVKETQAICFDLKSQQEQLTNNFYLDARRHQTSLMELANTEAESRELAFEKLSFQLETKERIIASLHSQLAAKEEEIYELTHTVEDLRDWQAKMKSGQVAAVIQRQKDADARVELAHAECRSHLQDKEVLRQRLRELEEAMKLKDDEIRVAHQRLQEREGEAQRLQRQMQAMQFDVSLMKIHLADVEKAAKNKEEAMDVEMQRQREKDRQVLRVEVDRLAELVRERATQVEDLQHTVRELEKENAHLQEGLQKATEMLRSRDDQLIELQEQLAEFEMHAHVNDKSVQLELLRRGERELKKRLAEQMNQNDVLQQDVHMLAQTRAENLALRLKLEEAQIVVRRQGAQLAILREVHTSSCRQALAAGEKAAARASLTSASLLGSSFFSASSPPSAPPTHGQPLALSAAPSLMTRQSSGSLALAQLQPGAEVGAARAASPLPASSSASSSVAFSSVSAARPVGGATLPGATTHPHAARAASASAAPSSENGLESRAGPQQKAGRGHEGERGAKTGAPAPQGAEQRLEAASHSRAQAAPVSMASASGEAKGNGREGVREIGVEGGPRELGRLGAEFVTPEAPRGAEPHRQEERILLPQAVLSRSSLAGVEGIQKTLDPIERYVRELTQQAGGGSALPFVRISEGVYLHAGRRLRVRLTNGAVMVDSSSGLIPLKTFLEGANAPQRPPRERPAPSSYSSGATMNGLARAGAPPSADKPSLPSLFSPASSAFSPALSAASLHSLTRASALGSRPPGLSSAGGRAERGAGDAPALPPPAARTAVSSPLSVASSSRRTPSIQTVCTSSRPSASPASRPLQGMEGAPLDATHA